MIGRLKKRRDFLLVAKGSRVERRPFVLESCQRDESGQPRFGFTVSKRTSKKAIERNRIRRRLKEAVRLAAVESDMFGRDYVLVGRRGALSCAFADLKTALSGALEDTSRSALREKRRGVTADEK